MFKQGKVNSNVIIIGGSLIVFLLLVIILLNFWVRLSIKEDLKRENPSAVAVTPSSEINNEPILKPGASKLGIVENVQPTDAQKIKKATLITNEAEKPTTEPVKEMPITSKFLPN